MSKPATLAGETFDFSLDHFARFGLPAQFVLDLASLEAAYREHAARWHPDRFALAAPAVQTHSLMAATAVNEAYHTLKSPLRRGRYVLKLAGVETEEETNTAMPVDFLMQQMEWREAISEAKSAGNEAALSRLQTELRTESAHFIAELTQQLSTAPTYPAAAMTVRKLRFMEKLDAEINLALDGLLF